MKSNLDDMGFNALGPNFSGSILTLKKKTNCPRAMGILLEGRKKLGVHTLARKLAKKTHSDDGAPISGFTLRSKLIYNWKLQRRTFSISEA